MRTGDIYALMHDEKFWPRFIEKSITRGGNYESHYDCVRFEPRAYERFSGCSRLFALIGEANFRRPLDGLDLQSILGEMEVMRGNITYEEKDAAMREMWEKHKEENP